MKRIVLGLIALTACESASWEPPALAKFPPQVGWSQGAPPRRSADACPTEPEEVSCEAGERLHLSLEDRSLALPGGRWVVVVDIPEKSYVTLGVSGPGDALGRFEIASRRHVRLRTGTLDDDHRLPAFVSFASVKADEVLIVVDASEPVRVIRTATSIYQPPKKDAPVEPVSLIGLPFPVEERAGYFMQAPHRYQFVRADVATALRVAFKQTRVRFKKNSIAVGDASQWNGVRPATDLGRPRHISHEGGGDVDIGLPATAGPSRLMRRCDGVLMDKEVLVCSPGTMDGLDGPRLAYLLALLIDGPKGGPAAIVDTIFTDQVYIDEIRKALPALRKKRWIHDDAFGALMEEGLLRHSAWHVDHVHIRFKGPAGILPDVLSFEASPGSAEIPSHGP